MPLSADPGEAQSIGERIHESIRPAGNGHGFRYVPQARRGNMSPAGDDGETSSEEEENDETPEPRTQAQAEYRRASIASRGRQASYAVEEDSDSETASDSDAEDDDEAPRRPIIHEPQTPRSRSRNPYSSPRVNFTISEIRAHSRGRERCDDGECSSDEEDALSVLHPSGFSDAASSPPREGWAGPLTPRETYPTPPPTDLHEELLDDFERLDCDAGIEEREAWVRKQKALKRAKRRSNISVQKRTFTESQGSETDDEDVRTEAGYESNAGSYVGSASGLRRLRRRTIEQGIRASLMFEDPPRRIIEQEEPETDVERHDTWSPPRRIPDVAMDELPYWSVRGVMEMEY